MKMGDILYNYKQTIQEEMNKISSVISRGSCSDYSEYQLQVGVLQGLEKSVEVLKEVIKSTQSEMGEED